MAEEIKLGIKLTADGRAMQAGIDQARDGLGRFTRGLADAAAPARSLHGALQALAAGLSVRELAQANMQWQAFTTTLKAVSGSAVAYTDNLTFLRKEANRLGLDLTSSGSAFAKFAASAKGTALEGKGVQEVFKGIAEAATVLHLSAEDTNGVLLALGQMMSKGTVQAEELRGQLGERIPGAFDAAARAMGVTSSQLGKMLEQGQVLAADLLPKLSRELSKTYGSGLGEATKGMQAELNRLKTSLSEGAVAFGQAGFNDAMISGMRQVRDLLASDTARTGAQLLGQGLKLAADNLDLLAAAGAAYLGIRLGPAIAAQTAALATFTAAQVAAARATTTAAAAQAAMARGGTAFLGLMGGWPGIILAGAAAVAYLATRETEAEKQTKAYASASEKLLELKQRLRTESGLQAKATEQEIAQLDKATRAQLDANVAAAEAGLVRAQQDDAETAAFGGPGSSFSDRGRGRVLDAIADRQIFRARQGDFDAWNEHEAQISAPPPSLAASWQAISEKINDAKEKLDPAIKAQKEYAELERNLTTAVDLGKISQQEKNRVLEQARAAYAQALDPIGEYLRKLREETDLLQHMAGADRDHARALQEARNLKPGRQLTPDETIKIGGEVEKKKLDELRDHNKELGLQAKQQEIVARAAGGNAQAQAAAARQVTLSQIALQKYGAAQAEAVLAGKPLPADLEETRKALEKIDNAKLAADASAAGSALSAETRQLQLMADAAGSGEAAQRAAAAQARLYSEATTGNAASVARLRRELEAQEEAQVRAIKKETIAQLDQQRVAQDELTQAILAGADAEKKLAERQFEREMSRKLGPGRNAELAEAVDAWRKQQATAGGPDLARDTVQLQQRAQAESAMAAALRQGTAAVAEAEIQEQLLVAARKAGFDSVEALKKALPDLARRYEETARAARTAATEAGALRQLGDLRDRVKVAQAEVGLVGASTVDRERTLSALRTQLELQRELAKVEPWNTEAQARIRATYGEIGQLNDQLAITSAQLQEAQAERDLWLEPMKEGLRQVQTTMAGVIKRGMKGELKDWKDVWGGFKEIALETISQIAAAMIFKPVIGGMVNAVGLGGMIQGLGSSGAGVGTAGVGGVGTSAAPAAGGGFGLGNISMPNLDFLGSGGNGLLNQTLFTLGGGPNTVATAGSVVTPGQMFGVGMSGDMTAGMAQGLANSGTTMTNPGFAVTGGQVLAGIGTGLAAYNFARNPGLGSGMSLAGSMMTLAGALNIIPVYGQIAGAVLAIAGSLIGNGKPGVPFASDAGRTDAAGNLEWYAPGSRRMDQAAVDPLKEMIADTFRVVRRDYGGTWQLGDIRTELRDEKARVDFGGQFGYSPDVTRIEWDPADKQETADAAARILLETLKRSEGLDQVTRNVVTHTKADTAEEITKALTFAESYTDQLALMQSGLDPLNAQMVGIRNTAKTAADGIRDYVEEFRQQAVDYKLATEEQLKPTFKTMFEGLLGLGQVKAPLSGLALQVATAEANIRALESAMLEAGVSAEDTADMIGQAVASTTDRLRYLDRQVSSQAIRSALDPTFRPTAGSMLNQLGLDDRTLPAVAGRVQQVLDTLTHSVADVQTLLALRQELIAREDIGDSDVDQLIQALTTIAAQPSTQLAGLQLGSQIRSGLDPDYRATNMDILAGVGINHQYAPAGLNDALGQLLTGLQGGIADQAQILAFSEQLVTQFGLLPQTASTIISQVVAQSAAIDQGAQQAETAAMQRASEAIQTRIQAEEELAQASERTRDEFLQLQTQMEDAVRNLQLDKSVSTLLVTERYAIAKQRFDQLFMESTSTDPERAKQAMAALPEAARDFAEVSRELYASSEQGIRDNQRIIASLQSVGVSASNQANIAEAQLNAAKASVGLLEQIRDKLAGTEEVKNRSWGAPENQAVNRILAETTDFKGDFGGGNFDRFMQTQSEGVREAARKVLRAASQASRITFAHGAAFEHGMIASSPTLFRMRDGRLGEFGEAGPETILPLAKMTSGHLGVRAIGASAGRAGAGDDRFGRDLVEASRRGADASERLIRVTQASTRDMMRGQAWVAQALNRVERAQRRARIAR